jgi:hypothetical protein
MRGNVRHPEIVVAGPSRGLVAIHPKERRA